MDVLPSSDVVLLSQLIGRESASTSEVWAARVEQTPDAQFLHFGGAVWTYAEAWQLIERAARSFRFGNTAGQSLRVASYLSNRPETIWTWFGAHRAGAVYAGLNREHKGTILADMLRRARATILVTEAEALDELPPDLEAMGIEAVVVVGDGRWHRAGIPRVVSFADILGGSEYDGEMPGSCDVATLMFTSGTTGSSKAVVLPHDMFCRGSARVAHAFGYSPEEVIHLWFPLFHVAAQLHMVMAGVVAGASISLQKTFSLSRFWDEVKQDRCTFFGGLPNVLKLLLEKAPADGVGQHFLRAGVVGPSPPPEVHEAFTQRFGVKLYDTYGMTEAEPLTLPAAEGGVPAGCCGYPNPDFELAVLDGTGLPCATGGRGELVARPRRPDIMMREYEGDPQRTLDAFRGLWFHTGDLAHFDDQGRVYVHGRLKHMIRRRGENISAWELENVVRGHPEIADCVVVGVPSPLGEEDVKLVVVLRPGASVSPAGLYSWCQSNMARFMAPRFVEFRPVLPRTEIGKVAVEQLRRTDTGVWDAESSARRPAPVASSRK